MSTETATKSETVLLRREGAIAWITLNRPDSANAINAEMVDALREIALDLVADDGCSVVVFQAAGRLFCGGGDVAAVHGAADPAGYLAHLALTLHDAVEAFHNSNIVVVAAVQGTAAVGGFSLVLNADLVIASEKAKFVAAYTGIGFSPDTGMSYLLPRVIGPRRANEMFYLGKVVDAATALDWGIANEVVAEDALVGRVAEIAAALAAGPTPALAQTKRLMREGSERGYHEHLADEAKTIVEMMKTPESQQLLGAFANKGK
ncbi:MAG: enoyl-CoA hydratase [Microbacteriaceae bacterium]|nr:enoyl-CoA hydratase [Microbacteriaceae bacterium]